MNECFRFCPAAVSDLCRHSTMDRLSCASWHYYNFVFMGRNVPLCGLSLATNPEEFHVLIQTILSFCNDFLAELRRRGCLDTPKENLSCVWSTAKWSFKGKNMTVDVLALSKAGLWVISWRLLLLFELLLQCLIENHPQDSHERDL